MAEKVFKEKVQRKNATVSLAREKEEKANALAFALAVEEKRLKSEEMANRKVKNPIYLFDSIAEWDRNEESLISGIELREVEFEKKWKESFEQVHTRGQYKLCDRLYKQCREAEIAEVQEALDTYGYEREAWEKYVLERERAKYESSRMQNAEKSREKQLMHKKCVNERVAE
jgi:hypothetical protein